MTAEPACARVPRIDPRVAAWAEQTLERAAEHLDQADDPLRAIARHARDVTAPDLPHADSHLVEQVCRACIAAIALVFVTDYRRLALFDARDAADPAKTAAAVTRLLADHPAELRPHLAHRAATKIAIHGMTI